MTTLKKMEDDLKKNGRLPKKNGRRANKKMEDDQYFYFFKWKTTFKKWEKRRRPQAQLKNQP